MGYYLQADTNDPEPLASTRGWADMKAWVAGLSPEYSALHHLCLYGWDERVPLLASQVKKALKEKPPTTDVQHTAEGLVALCAKNGITVVSITDGMST